MFFQSELDATLTKLEKISGLSQLFKFHKVKPAQLLSSVSAVVIATSMLGFSPSPVLAAGDCDQQTTTGALVWSVTQLGSECVVQFTSGTGTWTAPQGVVSLSRVLIAGAGGSGGQARTLVTDGSGHAGAAGGGGGQVIVASNRAISGAISLGIGAGKSTPKSYRTSGLKGDNTTFSELTALGGSGGQSGLQGTTGATGGTSGNGLAGGQGGAGFGGGGGGAAGAGKNSNPVAGLGVTSDITGEAISYGSGGKGAFAKAAPALNSDFGGGGGGSGWAGTSGAVDYWAHDGNSGVVIIRYALPFFDVTFDAQEGTAVAIQQTLQVDSAPSTTLEGFEFQGWFTAPSGGSNISFPYSPNANVTLYAQWLPLFTVTFDSQGGPTPGAQNVGKVLSAPSTTRDNFEFQGWFDSPSGGNPITFSYQPPSDITLYAQWLPIYTVTFDSQGGSNIDALVVSSISAQPATSKASFQLDGFFDSASGGTEIQFPFIPTEDNTIFAQWIPLYVVTFDSQEGTSVGPDETEAVASSPVISRSGFDLQGWFDSASGGSEISFPYSPTSDVTLFAQWLPIYDVTFDAQGGSTPAAQSVARVLTSPSTTKSNFEFQGWFDATTGGNQISFEYLPPSNITLYAQWLPIYTVTFNSRKGSSVDPLSTAGSISSPTPTRKGNVFEGWFTSPSGGQEISFPYAPTSDVTLYAQWIHGAISGIASAKLPTPTTIPIDGVTKSTFESSLGAGSSSKVEIPAGALPANTTVSIYTITDKDFVKKSISSSFSFLVTQIVSWANSDGDVVDALLPVVMTVTDPSIVAGSRIYSIMSEEVEQIGVATQDGQAVITFTVDPLITIAITSPDEPTNLSVTGLTQTSATLTWDAPVVNGGENVSGYTATASTGETCTSETLGCTMTGLSPNTAYTFTVIASNSKGDSPSSLPTSQQMTLTNITTLPSDDTQSPGGFTGPRLDSYVVAAGSARRVVLVGTRLDKVLEVWIASGPVAILKSTAERIEIELPSDLEAGVFDIVFETTMGQVTVIGGLLIVDQDTAEDPQSEPISKVSEGHKVNAGSFNGYVAAYAKGHKGQTLSWRIGSKWFKVLLTSDFQVFQRKANGIGLDVQVEIYIDGEKQLTKTLTTR